MALSTLSCMERAVLTYGYAHMHVEPNELCSKKSVLPPQIWLGVAKHSRNQSRSKHTYVNAINGNFQGLCIAQSVCTRKAPVERSIMAVR